MSNSEALGILQKELENRRNMSHSCAAYECDGCKYATPNGNVDEAIETAIEALELCVMIEDDKR